MSAVMLVGCLDSDNDPEPDATIPPTFSATTTFPVALNGMQQVPTNDSTQLASATVELDENKMSFKVVVDVTMISGVSAVHVHDGNIGRNGAVAFPLTEVASNTYLLAETELTADLIDDLKDGDWYINVHTTDFPDGEVRGQIVNDTTAIVTFDLSGSQEVPAVTTNASGYAYATVDTTDYDLDLIVYTNGANDATMAHIHTGRIGNNGPILVTLERSMDDMGVWMTPPDVMLDEATFAVLASGGHYVNVHTPANSSGELRGQILTDNFAIVTFNLSGSQEVPAVTTSATGSGYALVDTNDYGLELAVVTDGVDDATMAHIHTGRVGNNGPVLVDLEQSMNDMGMWTTAADASIDETIFAVLAGGGHYVNVHTPANPGGELRGQILTDNFVLITFDLSGDQQVPPVMSSASGDGYALVNVNGYDLELTAVTEGVDDATMAHIHTGVRGENGPIFVGLKQSMDDLGVWTTPSDAMIDEIIFGVLASGGHYVNVHTPANPSGELRGQIE